MLSERQGHNKEEKGPDLKGARRAALKAHDVVIKLKEMGLPQELDEVLASLSTDMGDLWAAQTELVERLDRFLESPDDWEAVGDHLVDLRASVEHIAWHVKSARRPLNRVAHFAYQKASQGENASG